MHVYTKMESKILTGAQCLLCGTALTARIRSQEHVIPKWLQKEIRFRLGDWALAVDFWHDTIHPEQKRNFFQNGHMNTTVVSDICQECNNNFLVQDIETPFQRLLPKLLSRGHKEFSESEKKIAARWCLKTAYMIDRRRGAWHTPPIHLKYLRYGKQTLPPNVFVTISRWPYDLPFATTAHHIWPFVAGSPTPLFWKHLPFAYRFQFNFLSLSINVGYMPSLEVELLRNNSCLFSFPELQPVKLAANFDEWCTTFAKHEISPSPGIFMNFKDIVVEGRYGVPLSSTNSNKTKHFVCAKYNPKLTGTEPGGIEELPEFLRNEVEADMDPPDTAI